MGEISGFGGCGGGFSGSGLAMCVAVLLIVHCCLGRNSGWGSKC